MAYPSSGVFSNLLWDNVDSSAMDDVGLKWRHQDVLPVTGAESVPLVQHCWVCGGEGAPPEILQELLVCPSSFYSLF